MDMRSREDGSPKDPITTYNTQHGHFPRKRLETTTHPAFILHQHDAGQTLANRCRRAVGARSQCLAAFVGMVWRWRPLADVGMAT